MEANDQWQGAGGPGAARCILVLGDQLSPELAVLRTADPVRDIVVMAEVREEAHYVPHNRHKIALVFAAMRHFRDRLRARGFRVDYYPFERGVATLREAVQQSLRRHRAASVLCCEPGEYRLLQAMRGWSTALGVPVRIEDDDRLLASRQEFAAWAGGRRQLRMEYFYREMRRRYGLLLDCAGEPEGGRWNYDRENRAGWRGEEEIPTRPAAPRDEITREVIDLVARAFPDNPGDLARFDLAVTPEAAQAHFDWFVEHALSRFGRYQDALAEESPRLFHSVVSMYLNIGLLQPLALCQQVERAWRRGRCGLAAAEGFIRQVLGWREYVRGVYWLKMPDYAAHNHLAARRPLPPWFWTADTDMRCLAAAVGQSLDLGYAHHIQRLMVIGNFALLAGLDVEAVCRWYLAVYADAFEWVELPNTLGMALYGDGGLLASKPYAASGRYIQRQGDHCRRCRYDPGRVSGEGACPYNSLYWHFIDRNLAVLESNPRMALALGNWRRKPAAQRRAILAWAGRVLDRHAPSGG